MPRRVSGEGLIMGRLLGAERRVKGGLPHHKPQANLQAPVKANKSAPGASSLTFTIELMEPILSFFYSTKTCYAICLALDVEVAGKSPPPWHFFPQARETSST